MPGSRAKGHGFYQRALRGRRARRGEPVAQLLALAPAARQHAAVAHLDRPWPWLRWANESVYPWYVLHQSFIVGIGFLLLPLGLGPMAEPALILLGTVAGCWLLNDLLIRRSAILRPLFGLKAAQRLPRA